MKKKFVFVFLFVSLFFLGFSSAKAATYQAKLTGNAVSLRSGPGTNYTKLASLSIGSTYDLVSTNKYANEQGCSDGWYKIYYSSQQGYVCATYVSVIEKGSSNGKDDYLRPWTSPRDAIVGGAKYIARNYIQKGQFTSYLKKFNVNPNGSYSLYNHQYMANLAAPYSESYSSYKSYRDNGLLSLPLEFTIPIFNNMPAYTILPGSTANTACQGNVTDQAFENKLNAEGFPESYKCKLRLIHNSYPNWIFKALKTNIEFANAVRAEQAVSAIQGGDKYYDLSSGGRVQVENGWYKPNYDTTAYYLDPRNFLIVERILMFENLSYSANYSEAVVQNILNGTFMQGKSAVDNKNYSAIFVEAGQTANTSPVYLASLARQESGVNGSRATTGAQFTYKGITYKGLYNFFNIGANSSAESPILAGLVWASGGSTSVIVNTNTNTGTNTSTNSTSLTPAIVNQKVGSTIKNNCLVINAGMTVANIKSKLSGFSVTVTGSTDILKTGNTIKISLGSTSLTYSIAAKGDANGDGQIKATDYVKIKNNIMGRAGGELNQAQKVAADYDGNGSVGATDYVKIKNHIMGR